MNILVYFKKKRKSPSILDCMNYLSTKGNIYIETFFYVVSIEKRNSPNLYAIKIKQKN